MARFRVVAPMRFPPDGGLRAAALGLGALLSLLAPLGFAAAPRSRPIQVESAGQVQVGKASYYHPSFAGETTASGAPLRLDAMTAASRTLPLGTLIQVTNAENGASVVLLVNDRGPYAKNRILDVTPRAARALGIDRHDGVAKVRVKPLRKPKPPR